MKKILVLFFAMLLLAPVAQAGEWYVGGSVQQTTIEVDLGSSSVDEDDTGFKAFGGYRFFKFFGVEASYVDLGGVSDSSGSVDLTAFDVFAVGNLPLGENWVLFGKAGYYRWDAEVSGSPDEDDTDLAYGVGAAFRFNDLLAVRAEYELFEVDEDKIGADVDVDAISVGLEIRF